MDRQQKLAILDKLEQDAELVFFDGLKHGTIADAKATIAKLNRDHVILGCTNVEIRAALVIGWYNANTRYYHLKAQLANLIRTEEL